MNRKEFNLLVEGWKSFLNETEIPTIHQGSDPVQALGAAPAVSPEERASQAINKIINDSGYDYKILKRHDIQDQIIGICRGCNLAGDCDRIVRDLLDAIGQENIEFSIDELVEPFENLSGVPKQYVEVPSYDAAGNPVRGQELNPEYIEFMAARGRTNENISESRLRSIIKSVINESSESYKNDLLSGYKELLKRCYAECTAEELEEQIALVKGSFMPALEANNVSALEIVRAENEAAGIEVSQS
tara:strand:+ start:64 stop:798 length:735 start_codon:yes stop_codon:yes gene_type:complete